jgi:hypothetical protein
MRLLAVVLGTLLLSVSCAREPGKSAAETKAPVPDNSVPAPTQASTQTSRELFARWIDDQLNPHNAALDRIVDEQPWTLAPAPNTYIVLGIAKRRSAESMAASRESPFFSFVLLVQSEAAERLISPKLLGARLPYWGVPDDSVNSVNHLKAIEASSIQIRKNEYAFGIRFREGITGKLSSVHYEVLSLLRYHEGELQEVFRDVVWGYLRTFDGVEKVCAVDAHIVSQPSEDGEFFTLTRKYRGLSLDYPAGEPAPTGCRAFPEMERAKRHVWDPKTGKYLDPKGIFLPWDFAGKGYL